MGKNIPMIKFAGPKDLNKGTFTGFAAGIFNPVQAKMVNDHVAGHTQFLLPYIPFMFTRLVKHLQNGAYDGCHLQIDVS